MGIAGVVNMRLLYCFLIAWLMVFSLNGPALSEEINKKDSIYLALAGEDSAEEEEWMEDPFADEGEGPAIPDPLERFNRGVFYFNDKVYTYLLDPAARGYTFVVPEKARESVSNFFSNLISPIRFVNCLFQGKFQGAASEFARFCINTTFGVAGLFDPARSHWKINRHREDFGQTLGYYGLGQGFYLVIPLIGPSSARDGAGLVVDLLFDPRTYLLKFKPWFVARTLQEVNYTSFHLGEYEDMVKQAVDPYLFMRSSYVQYRARLVNE